jgi:hypothetical protein
VTFEKQLVGANTQKNKVTRLANVFFPYLSENISIIQNKRRNTQRRRKRDFTIKGDVELQMSLVEV